MTGTRIFRIYWNMRNRCENENSDNYNRYGGSGISVCDRWKDFVNFYEDMKDGYSEELQIDRIDNSKGYSKENCRWVTKIEQANNKHDNVFVEYMGIKKTIAEWARVLRMNYFTLQSRITKRGWNIERALSTTADGKTRQIASSIPNEDGRS